MTKDPAKHFRVLAIAPSTRGFGYAVLEGGETLVDWGVKSVSGDKNAKSLTKLDELIEFYRPDALVLQDASTRDSRRSPRIRELGRQIVALANDRKIKVGPYSREKVLRFLFTDGKGTKHDLAEKLAERFPEELGSRLPPKRRPWMSEDSRMDIFEAVALGWIFKPSRRQLDDRECRRIGENHRCHSANATISLSCSNKATTPDAYGTVGMRVPFEEKPHPPTVNDLNSELY